LIKSVVAVDRYNVIVKGMSGSPLTFKKVTSWIAIGWLWSLFWATSPLYPGWGKEYVIDGMLGSYKLDKLFILKRNQRNI